MNTTREQTVAILASPDRAPVHASSLPGRLLAAFDRAARYRRNPRPPEYMRSLAAEVFPGAEILEVHGTVPAARIAAASHIVLLWPDAIGFGWSPIERGVFRARRRAARVSALTGRRRSVPLTRRTLLAFRLRRVAERLWLGEIATAAAMLVTAPVLVGWDLAKGRR